MDVHKSRTAAEVLSFFASHDVRVSHWVRQKSAGERKEILRVLDATLNSTDRTGFDRSLAELMAKNDDCTLDAGSRESAAFLSRMLGFEYERLFDAAPTAEARAAGNATAVDAGVSAIPG